MATSIQSSTPIYGSGTAHKSTEAKKPDLNKTSTTSSKNSSSAPTLEERYFLVGAFYDVLKTIPRILSGSYLTAILKSVLKDSHPTYQTIIYKTSVDDLPSRFLCDTLCALMVRLFNGKTKLFGLFKLPYIVPEITSQILAHPVVSLSRAATSKFNINRKSAKHNLSPKEEALRDAIRQQPFAQSVDKIREFFDKHLKSKLNFIFSKALGVQEGKMLKDSEGSPILDDKGKPVWSEPKVNLWHLGGVLGVSFLGSLFLLPKKTQAFGFDAVKGPARGIFNIFYTTFLRLSTTVLSAAAGMHLEGKNFDAVLETSIQDKTFVPLIQYTCDAAAAVFSYRIPFFNGASLAMILRLFAEIPASFLVSGLMRVAKKSRMSDEWSYLSHRVLKPFTKIIEFIAKPILKAAHQNFFTHLPLVKGIYNPNIPNMYDVDIAEHKHEHSLEEEEAQKYEGNFWKTLGLLIKKGITTPADTLDLIAECTEQSKKRQQAIQLFQNLAEKKIHERKIEAEVQARLQQTGNTTLHQAPDSKPNKQTTSARSYAEAA